jgi:hypothetical protein
MTWQRHAVRLAGPPELRCPACDGQGELWVSGDPRGPNVETRECWLCHGGAFVPVAVAEDHRAMLAADKARRENPPEDPTPRSQGDPWPDVDWSEPPPF